MKQDRRRYVLFHLHSDKGTIGDKKLIQTIRRSLLTLFGELAVADSRLYLSSYDSEEGRGVLQCTQRALYQVLASAALIGSIDGKQVSFQPLRTSGTLRGLNQAKIKL
jgi:RNase P/RNase MRP subunit POP5